MSLPFTGAALMREIDLSVLSWCSDHAPADAVFHGALLDEWNPTDEELALAAENFFEVEGRAPRRLDEIVFRKPTWAHIPADQGHRAAPSKGVAATGLRFQPFEHYRYRRHRPVCVLRSHWVGKVRGGRYRAPDGPQGRMTERLGEMCCVLAERFSKRGNWRGYTHVDEMAGDARLKLMDSIMKFSPLRSPNPIGYATLCMQSAFTTSVTRYSEVWEHERHLGESDVSNDGEGFEAGMKESWTEAADREFEAGQVAFNRSAG